MATASAAHSLPLDPYSLNQLSDLLASQHSPSIYIIYNKMLGHRISLMQSRRACELLVAQTMIKRSRREREPNNKISSLRRRKGDVIRCKDVRFGEEIGRRIGATEQLTIVFGAKFLPPGLAGQEYNKILSG